MKTQQENIFQRLSWPVMPYYTLKLKELCSCLPSEDRETPFISPLSLDL